MEVRYASRYGFRFYRTSQTVHVSLWRFDYGGVDVLYLLFEDGLRRLFYAFSHLGRHHCSIIDSFA